MIRLTTLTLFAVLGTPFVVSCASAPPPFGTPYEAYRGFKARTFVGTPEDVRPSVHASLREMGFDVHMDAEDTTYITANRGMAAQDPEIAGSTRTWMRVGIQIRHVDKHRRAPRTLIELEAENVQGTSGGPISASFGAVPSSFYDEFFANVETRVKPASMPHGLLPPA